MHSPSEKRFAFLDPGNHLSQRLILLKLLVKAAFADTTLVLEKSLSQTLVFLLDTAIFSSAVSYVERLCFVKRG